MTKKLRCYVGRHRWTRMKSGREQHWACRDCGKERMPPPPDEYIPPAAPGAGSGW